jgi:hypothetical protein
MFQVSVPQLLDIVSILNNKTLWQLVYLTWFSPFILFTETLRKYPILPFLDRTCFSEYKLSSPSGNKAITLPAGTGVFVSVLGIQHDPLYFPQPDMFDPDRFTEQNKRSRPNYTYIPFGEGPRMCIGNITLSILHYEIVAFKDRTVKFTKLRFVRPCSSVGTKWMSQSHTQKIGFRNS